MTTFLSACNFEQLDQLLKLDTHHGSVKAKDMIEQYVETPGVFKASEDGVWDGRQSLGGVWVAHPKVKMPERALIHREANDASVTGTLFRRERESPNPRFQVSSEAASALGILANSPTKLTVTVLRKQMVTPYTKSIVDTKGKGIAQNIKDDSNKNSVSGKEFLSIKSAKIKNPFVQVGIFRIKNNANKTGENMRRIGIKAIIKEQKIKGRIFWRVIVGPLNSLEEREVFLKNIISAGFEDAYAVKY